MGFFCSLLAVVVVLALLLAWYTRRGMATNRGYRPGIVWEVIVATAAAPSPLTPAQQNKQGVRAFEDADLAQRAMLIAGCGLPRPSSCRQGFRAGSDGFTAQSLARRIAISSAGGFAPKKEACCGM